MSTSSTHSNINSLNKAVLDAYYERRMGGVVVFHGVKYVLAIEFFGPSGNRGAQVEMVLVDDDRKSQALVELETADSGTRNCFMRHPIAMK